MTATPKASNFREKNQFSMGQTGGGPIITRKKGLKTNPRKGGGINRSTQGTKQK
ncbi:hypothetical protein LCGC14_1048840 [marine sediment metagenome]|uniref:Uncharacterized protein n=1 Tax=marine sediment metagenome TaxID=412755 RepID=A0A0F9Q7J4_9ZZZZ